MQESLIIAFDAEQHRGWVRRTLLYVTQGFAMAGGLLLIGLIAMSMVSIIGRKLLSMPVRGDMELVEVGAAIAIAAFLPLCELRGTHIKVDALTSWLPARVRDTLDCIGHLLCCAAAWILAWRTWLQMLEIHAFGETTTLLAFPLWIPLLLIVPSLVLLGLCALARVQDICRKAGRRS